MSIREWPAEDRPREKLLMRGATALTDAELLAIFLRTGSAGRSAVELSRELLARFGSLAAVVAADRAAFVRVKGLGEAKYVQLQAAVELSRRALAARLAAQPVMDSPQAVTDYLRLALGFETVEVFVALWLDASHRLIAMEELFRGTLVQTSVYPREVVKAAIARNAAAVIFAHNHPSGNTEPSAADRHLTGMLKSALSLIDVRLLDHCIIGATTAPTGSARAVHSMAACGEL